MISMEIPTNADDAHDVHEISDAGATTSESFLLHLEAERRSPRTIDSYRRILRKAASIAEKDLSTFSRLDIDKVRAWMRRTGYSDSTRHLTSCVLRGFFKHIGRTDLVDSIKLESVSWLPREPPTISQIGQVIASAKTWEEKALILLLYSTGLRLRELIGDVTKGTRPISLEDIDWQRRRIRIRGGKGSGPSGKEDYVYFMLMDDETIQAIKKYTDGRHTGPIFRISARRVQALVKRIGTRCGVHLTPHLLRHASATHLIQKDVGIVHVQTHLRHKSIETTRRYTRITGEDMEAVRKRLKEEVTNA